MAMQHPCGGNRQVRPGVIGARIFSAVLGCERIWDIGRCRKSEAPGPIEGHSGCAGGLVPSSRRQGGCRGLRRLVFCWAPCRLHGWDEVDGLSPSQQRALSTVNINRVVRLLPIFLLRLPINTLTAQNSRSVEGLQSLSRCALVMNLWPRPDVADMPRKHRMCMLGDELGGTMSGCGECGEAWEVEEQTPSMTGEGPQWPVMHMASGMRVLSRPACTSISLLILCMYIPLPTARNVDRLLPLVRYVVVNSDQRRQESMSVSSTPADVALGRGLFPVPGPLILAEWTCLPTAAKDSRSSTTGPLGEHDIAQSIIILPVLRVLGRCG